MSNEVSLDDLDREILFHLRQDGRLTNVELAKRVGLTPPPCLRRVKRLEEAGVITGYRAVISPEAIGRGLEVLVDVEIYAQDRKSFEEFESIVASYDEVIEFSRMYGRPDYFIRVAVADHAAYETFLTGKLSCLPAVLRLESHLTMKEIKTLGVPTRQHRAE
ncbi:Lrp/AsnC family transcriptional regulator [Streptomyces celluloflavus]|uniref:Lrp/AsnC family transcriptional regulator n=1 Tax=Streptomyces celluloflavus TaxID=58344 RepID=UPI003662158F